MVQAIPNLAVDKIMVRKKRTAQLQNRDGGGKTIARVKPDVIPPLLLDEEHPPLPRSTPSPARRATGMLSKSSNKIKWRIIKQKVVQSPTNECEV